MFLLKWYTITYALYLLWQPQSRGLFWESLRMCASIRARMRWGPGLCGLHSRGCISCPINYKHLNRSYLMEMRGPMWECFSVCLERPSHLSVNTFSRVTDQTSRNGREQRAHRGLTRITTEVSHTPAGKANNRLFVCVCVRVWYVLGQGAWWDTLMLSGTIYLRSVGNRLHVIGLQKSECVWLHDSRLQICFINRVVL